mgnify:CR=1 FL=1
MEVGELVFSSVWLLVWWVWGYGVLLEVRLRRRLCERFKGLFRVGCVCVGYWLEGLRCSLLPCVPTILELLAEQAVDVRRPLTPFNRYREETDQELHKLLR